jgi:hypothetical protein
MVFKELNVVKNGELEWRGKGEGKIIPLQPWREPEGSRKLKLPDFKTIGT